MERLLGVRYALRAVSVKGCVAPISQPHAKRFLNVLGAHTRGILWRLIGRRIKLHHHPASPTDFVQMRFERDKIDPSVTQREKRRILHHVGTCYPLLAPAKPRPLSVFL